MMDWRCLNTPPALRHLERNVPERVEKNIEGQQVLCLNTQPKKKKKKTQQKKTKNHNNKKQPQAGASEHSREGAGGRGEARARLGGKRANIL